MDFPTLSTFLIEAGLESYQSVFDEAEVDLDSFLLLTEKDLEDLGIKLGPRKKLLLLSDHINETLNGGIPMPGKHDSDDENRDRAIKEEEGEEGEEESKAKEKKKKKSEKGEKEKKKSKSKDKEKEKKREKEKVNEKKPEQEEEEDEEEEEEEEEIEEEKIAEIPSSESIESNRVIIEPILHSMLSNDIVKNKDKSSHMVKLAAVPDISADEIEHADMQGWLLKQGAFVKNWKKRWFVLKGPCLYYFPSPAKTKAKGMITLPSYSIISAEKELDKPLAFQAYHQSARTYYFVANNGSDMTNWMKALQKAADLSTIIPDRESSGKAKPKRINSTNNMYAKFNTFDVRIKKRPNQIIGLDIKVTQEYGTLVTKVHEGTAASETEIAVGDQILKIQGSSIIGLTTPDVVQMLKRVEDTFVLSIRRPE